MKCFLLSCVGVAIIASVTTLCCQAARLGDHADFFRGLSSVDTSVEQLLNVGATHVRRYIFWSGVEPTLHQLDHNLTLSVLKADPQQLIYNWGAAKDWSYGDAQVVPLLAAGITPVVELSEGTFYGLPAFNGTVADPDVIGVDLYLAYQYRFCRAAVHRYKSMNISLYQIENELNEAFLSGFYGQRRTSLLWGNWTFLTLLLSTLRDAVKDEDPSANVTMNFHTDVPDVVHELIGLPGYYTEAVADWAHLLDYIALDAYPNMYVASPLGCNNVSDRVATAMRIVNGSKPVFIMESGYPVLADNESLVAPAALNFSKAQQAAYAQTCIESVQAVHGAGFFYFEFTSSPGMLPPPGGYTAADAAMFTAIRNFLWSNNVMDLIDWLLEPGSWNEMLHRASYFMGQPDQRGWGAFEMDGTPRPVVEALKNGFAAASH